MTSKSHVVRKMCNWTYEQNARYICVANVHMCMEVFDNPDYEGVVNNSDITVADGKPIFLAQKVLGNNEAQQVRGEDITLALCVAAEEQKLSVGFFGATDELLHKLKNELEARYTKLNIEYLFSPPFRPTTDEEDKSYIQQINGSGVSILFVGLGCPKQEIWMAEHKAKLSCVMLGVGAAFDFIAGNKKNAPKWMQSVGLEWLYRLFSEPKRLWKRYLIQNPRFIYYFTLQLLGRKY